MRNRILRYLDDPVDHGSFAFTVNYYGNIYKGNLDNLIDWEVYYFGAYAASELCLLYDLIKNKENAIVWDVGANVGNHALFMARYARKVYAFEPYSPVADILENRINDNEINNIELIRVGLGDINDKKSFVPPSKNNLGTGSFINKPETGIDGNTVSLDIRTGDSVARDLHLDKPDLVKIDVEGYEGSVLKGMQDSIHKFRPAIFMEWSSATEKDLNVDDLRQLLPEQYKIYQFYDHKPFMFLFNRQGYRLELIKDVPREGNILLLPAEWSVF